MFKRHIVATSLVLVAIAAIAIMTVLTYSEAEHKALQDIVGNDAVEQENHPLHQRRIFVRRDIRGGTAPSKNVVLFSDQADLVLDFFQKEAVENLTHPRAYIQEAVFTDSTGALQQTLRFLEAEKGVYYHQPHLVTLDTVTVAQFTTPGNKCLGQLPPDVSSMKGSAKFAKVFLAEGPRFEVSDLEGTTGSGMTVKADTATYDKLTLALNGSVELGGPGGHAQAAHITFLTPETGGSWQTAQLRDGVTLTMNTGACLTCDQGDIDMAEGCAIFRAIDPVRKVMWQERTPEGHLKKVACRDLLVRFDGALDQTPQLKEIVANTDVTVTMEGQWIATGDTGTFIKTFGVDGKEGGSIALGANGGRRCCVDTPKGDHLEAVRIVCDADNSNVILHHVNGSLSRPGKDNVSLAAKEAHWNDAEGLLILKDGAMVEDTMGHLENDELVRVRTEQNGTERELTQLEAFGFTRLAMRSGSGRPAQVLTCQGEVSVDHVQCYAIFRSPKDANGDIPRSGQVTFKDGSAELHADEIVVKYTVDQGHVTPYHIVADGSVCLRGHLGIDSPQIGARYALCDVLEYWPENQTILLTAKTGRVALLDAPNGVAVSSPAVEVRRDPITHKDIVKGLGDVRFSLLDREYQRLKERFNTDLNELP